MGVNDFGREESVSLEIGRHDASRDRTNLDSNDSAFLSIPIVQLVGRSRTLPFVRLTDDSGDEFVGGFVSSSKLGVRRGGERGLASFGSLSSFRGELTEGEGVVAELNGRNACQYEFIFTVKVFGRTSSDCDPN